MNILEKWTDVVGAILVTAALVSTLVVAADLADAQADYREVCQEGARNTDECRHIASDIVAHEPYELTVLSLLPVGAIGGMITIYGGRATNGRET